MQDYNLQQKLIAQKKKMMQITKAIYQETLNLRFQGILSRLMIRNFSDLADVLNKTFTPTYAKVNI